MTASADQIAGLEDAIGALRAGELVVYPTETFYGIAADPFSPNALEKVFAIKGRDANKPIALIAADSAMAFAIAREVPAIARRLASAFWPGPLTMVIPARRDFPPQLIGPDGGVGIRVSSHPIARALSRVLGHPITATSANLSGEPPASTADAARQSLGNKVKVFLEGGILTAAAPSTVIACDADGFRIMRNGAISERELTAALSLGIST
ncbi:MAG TPA: L-threonylcarbamoyladenylate synthase [Candidatus Binataceae bacterium]|nr:L-threonylcarbamoyladenylate synthase [Candidatus Binataceae bacterium]